MNETIPLEAAPEPMELPREVPHRAGRTRGLSLRGLSLRVRTAAALILCVAAVLCRIFAPVGAEELKRWVVGDGGERLQQAVFQMERSLEAGEDLAEAWAAFRGELADEPA